jgi:hypothetical protein
MSAVATIGRPTEAHLEYARQLIDRLPEALSQAAREPYGARAVVYALVIAGQESRDPGLRERQAERLGRHADSGIAELTGRLLPSVESLDVQARLPLIDLLVPSLRALSPVQFQVFRANVRALIRADDRLDLFEWALLRILRRHVAPQFERQRPPRSLHDSFGRLTGAVEQLLSAVAQAGVGDPRSAFAAGAERIPVALTYRELPVEAADLDPALDDLITIAPKLKQQLIEACARAIMADHEVSVDEAELLRAIGDGLGCPIPPLLPGQSLSAS